MIVPSARTASELAKTGTEPVILGELQFNPTLYLSTRDSITYDGRVYQESQFDVTRVELGDFGEQRATLRISPSFVSTVLNPGIIDLPVILKMLWGQEPFDPGDAIDIHVGVVSNVNVSVEWIDVHTTQVNTNAVVSPRYYYSHQNLQPSGTIISLWGRTIEIQRAEYT